jgi:hypothetical protein
MLAAMLPGSLRYDTDEATVVGAAAEAAER